MKLTFSSAYQTCNHDGHVLLVDHELTSEPDPETYCLCGRTQRRMYDWVFFPDAPWSRCAHNQPMETSHTDQCTACAKLCQDKRHLQNGTHVPEVVCRAVLIKQERTSQPT